MNFGKTEKPRFVSNNTANQTIYAIHVKMMGVSPTLKNIFTPFPSEDPRFYF